MQFRGMMLVCGDPVGLDRIVSGSEPGRGRRPSAVLSAAWSAHRGIMGLGEPAVAQAASIYGDGILAKSGTVTDQVPGGFNPALGLIHPQKQEIDDATTPGHRRA